MRLARRFATILLVSLTAPLAAQRPAPPPPPPKPVSFTADAGFVQTSGNTDVTTINIGEKLGYKQGPWSLDEYFSLVYGRNAGVTNTSLWRSGVHAGYALSSRVGVYALVAYDRNTFAGISRRLEEGTGLSFLLIDRPADHLDFEAGISFFQQRPTPDSLGVVTDDYYVAGRAAAAYRHKFSEKATFGQAVEVLPAFNNGGDVRVNTETSLSAPISKRIGIKLSYVIRYDNTPQPGLKTTDRLFTSGLQFSF